MFHTLRNHWKTVVGIGFIIFIYIVRVVVFSASFGAVEHDSGWFLGVAKNLAERGIYASYTNTISQEGIGAHISIHSRDALQDEDGYMYFPAEVTLGPGYIFPQAFFLNIFGNGYWQYRILPIISYGVLIGIVLTLLYYLGGSLAVLLFSIWFYVLPQLSIQFAYEAFSEHLGLLYLLISFCFVIQIRTARFTKVQYIVAGIFFSFACLTKTFFIINCVAFCGLFLLDLYNNKGKRIGIIALWSYFILGYIFAYGTFEFYRFIVIYMQFGGDGYTAINTARNAVFTANGSGVSLQSFYDVPFIVQKLAILKELGIRYPIVGWMLLLSSIINLRYISSSRKRLYILFWIAMVGSFAWYIFLSPTGWGRHIWHGLVMGMIVSSVFISRIFIKLATIDLKARIILLCSVLSVSFSTYKMNPNIFISQEHINFLNESRYIYGIQGFPSVPIFSLSDQRAIVNYFMHYIHPDDTVYYLGWYLVAELSPLVDKVFYPFARYIHNPTGHEKDGKRYIIFGPYQKGNLKIANEDYLDEKIHTLCGDIAYENDSYTLCTIKTPLTQEESDVGLNSDY